MARFLSSLTTSAASFLSSATASRFSAATGSSSRNHHNLLLHGGELADKAASGVSYGLPSVDASPGLPRDFPNGNYPSCLRRTSA
jgi:hypothetical protein